MVDNRDSKSRGRKAVRVQVPPRPPSYRHKKQLTVAYIVGVALGDGNLSNPNGRAVRLRITCDTQYPHIRDEIVAALHELFPRNKVTLVRKSERCFDISVYSNALSEILPWRVSMGSKFMQRAHVPDWILQSKKYSGACLRGLIQTDGSIYKDRIYTMVNFTNNTEILVRDVVHMMRTLGYQPTFHSTTSIGRNKKFTARLAKSSLAFITEIGVRKA